MEKVLHRIYEGHGTAADILLLESVANQITGKCLCALGEFATSPVLSSIAHFLPEYKAKIKSPTGQRCGAPNRRRGGRLASA